MTQALAISWGPWEIGLILAVFLLFFGSSRLPKMARSLGSSLTEFKKGLRGDPGEDEETRKLRDAAEEKQDEDPPKDGGS